LKTVFVFKLNLTVIAPYRTILWFSEYNSEKGLSAKYTKTINTFYKNPTMREFLNPVYFTRDKWLRYHSSMEGVPIEGDAEYETYFAKLNNKFDRDSESGLLCLNFVTYVYGGKINY